MKTLTIALKDLTRSLRSAFALVFMFAVPLMVTGMFYLMFGNNATASANTAPAAVQVAVANLDQGTHAPAQDSARQSLGQGIVQALQSPALSGVIRVSLVPDAASARQAVDGKQAAVAIIIPAGSSAAYADPQGQATIELYQDPGASQAVGTVKAVLEPLLDGMAGARIAASIAAAGGSGGPDPAFIAGVVQRLQDPSGALLNLQSPASRASGVPAANPTGQMLAQLMGGMMILFAFFNGGSSSESLLREDEAGTLARLFATPTRHSSILGGKFLAVGLTVLVQVSLLLAAAHLIFGIRWGDLLPVALSALGIVACAAAFGIFITSLLKNTRQGGVVYGGLITITGMLGMMTVFTGSQGGVVDVLSKLVPQGWALRGLTLSLSGASLGEVALNFSVLLALSVVFFTLGVLRFQKRYAG